MNLKDAICEFIENTQNKTAGKPDGKIERQTAEKEETSAFELSPREGMSMESAKFAIGRCVGNSQFEIHSIENKGRYFTAKILDSKGKQVNEILVDKLNGKVQFLR